MPDRGNKKPATKGGKGEWKLCRDYFFSGKNTYPAPKQCGHFTDLVRRSMIVPRPEQGMQRWVGGNLTSCFNIKRMNSR